MAQKLTKKIEDKDVKTKKKSVSKTMVAVKSVKKTSAMTEKKAAKTTKPAETIAPLKHGVRETVSSKLTTPVYGVDGKTAGTVALPEFYFGSTVNKQLISQAIRVYLANQREGSAATKTRGLVSGSTRKIYKQKGTGNARHGSIRAPIFVGGGIVFGPVPHSFRLEMPKKMKVKALAGALTQRYQDQAVKVVDGMESLPSKTKSFVQMFASLSCSNKILVLLAKDELSLTKSMRNIEHVSVLPVSDVSTYVVMNTAHVVFSKKAVMQLSEKVSN